MSSSDIKTSAKVRQNPQLLSNGRLFQYNLFFLNAVPFFFIVVFVADNRIEEFWKGIKENGSSTN